MILITGANGRLGYYVSRTLSSKNMKLRLMSRENIPRLKNSTNLKADLFDENSLTNACKGVDTVIHLAATLDYLLPGKEIMRINYQGTKNILDAALASGATKFIYASSVAVYGKQKDTCIREDVKLAEKDPYGLSKIKSEDIIKKSGIDYTILRPTVIYGKGFYTGYETILQLIKSGKMRIVGDGNNKLHLTHAQDVAQAFYLAAKKEAFNDVFNVAGPDTPTQNELLTLIASYLGVDPPTKKVDEKIAVLGAGLKYIVARIKGERHALLTERIKTIVYVRALATNRCYDISKAKNILGYDPVIGYEKGMKEFLHYLDS